VNTQRHIVGLLLTSSLLTLSLNQPAVNAVIARQVAAPPAIPVEYLPVSELPLTISLSELIKTDKGYSLKGSAANNSSDQILGVTFLLLVIDSENKVRASANWTAELQLDSYSGKEFSLKAPVKAAIRSRDRVILAADHVFGRESIWRVMNARESIEGYARAHEYETPKVRRIANQFDPPPGAALN